MLYFDDFMEAIENLPSELKDNLTTVRHLDLQTQNGLESIRESKRLFFENCKYGRHNEIEQNSEFNKIVGSYERISSFADEKKNIVSGIYSTYLKLMKKLDSELEKFRMELEADNSGISERIEKKINALFGNQNGLVSSKLEDRKLKSINTSSNGGYSPFLDLNGSSNRTCIPGDKRNLSLMLSSSTTSNKSLKSRTQDKYFSPSTTPTPHNNSMIRRQSECSLESFNTMDLSPSNYMHGQEGFLFNDKTYISRTSAIAQDKLKDTDSNASSNANNNSNRRANRIANSRRSVNPKLIFKDEESTLLNSTDVVFLNDDPLSSDAGNQVVQDKNYHRSSVTTFSDKRSNNSGFDDDNSSIHSQTSTSYQDGITSNINVPSITANEKKNKASSGNDDDLQLYCFCRNVSYGDMIACDNPNCPFEWFHYECVGLSVAPRGQWFCTSCQASNLQNNSSNSTQQLHHPNQFTANNNPNSNLNSLISNTGSNKSQKKKSRR